MLIYAACSIWKHVREMQIAKFLTKLLTGVNRAIHLKYLLYLTDNE